MDEFAVLSVCWLCLCWADTERILSAFYTFKNIQCDFLYRIRIFSFFSNRLAVFDQAFCSMLLLQHKLDIEQHIYPCTIIALMEKLKANEREHLEFIARNKYGARHPYECESICSMFSVQCSLTSPSNQQSKSINFFKIYLKISAKLFSLKQFILRMISMCV